MSIDTKGGERSFAASANSDQLSAEADLRRSISAHRDVVNMMGGKPHC
jgi:hypothetical protein